MNISDSPDLDLAKTEPSAPEDYAVMVLLVDDQAMMGEAVRRALANEANIDYHFCADALDALKIAESVKPTVILQDLVMPGVDGLTLVRQYRASPQTRDTPIIVLSTREEPTTKRDAFLAGANDYLVKFPDALELIARIRYHSRAYINQLQRDEAYRALRESQQKLIAANLELQSLSNVDGLTCLSNRRHFDEYLEGEWRRGAREQNCLSLLMIDVDDFKAYNDTYGHLEGDRILRVIAQTARGACLRAADLVARFGGEEFSVVLPATSSSGAKNIGEKICAALAALAIPHTGSSVNGRVTISIGVATAVPSSELSSQALLKLADEALYQAKREGKDRVVTAS